MPIISFQYDNYDNIAAPEDLVLVLLTVSDAKWGATAPERDLRTVPETEDRAWHRSALCI